MNKGHSEAVIEIPSNSIVSSTMKRVENDDSQNFNISNMIDDTRRFTSQDLRHGSEKLVQSSCSPISTTQIIPAENHHESSAVDAASSSSMNNNNSSYNISNPDTTTVQGNVCYS